MDVGGGLRVAAGPAYVVEYLLAPEAIPMPRTPRHCVGLLVWREHMIPVIDLARLSVNAPVVEGETPRAVVLVYQEAPGEPLHYGALLVRAAPQETWVSDDMACPLPSSPPALKHLARSCFTQAGRPIPIVNTHRLFARSLPVVAAAAEAGDEARATGANGRRDAAPVIRRDRVASDERRLLAHLTLVEPRKIADVALPAVVGPPSPFASAPSVDASRIESVRNESDLAPVCTEPVSLAIRSEPFDFAQDKPIEPPKQEIAAPAPEAEESLPEMASLESEAMTDLAPEADLIDEIVLETPPAPSPRIPAMTVPAEPDTASPEPQAAARARAVATAAAPEKRTFSDTVQSYRRLVETQPSGLIGRRTKWLLAALGMTVALFVAAQAWRYTVATVSTPAASQIDQPRATVRDVAPGAIEPVFSPSSPVQPPK